MQYGNARIALFKKDGQQIGLKLRRHISKKRDLVKAANIILLNKANQVLMIKARSSLWPGKWGGSCAGLVRLGESIVDAAHRILLRELRIQAPLQPLDERYRTFGEVRRIFPVLVARTKEEPRISRQDISEARWVSLSDAEAMVESGVCTPAFAAALSVAKRYLKPWVVSPSKL